MGQDGDPPNSVSGWQGTVKTEDRSPFQLDQTSLRSRARVAAKAMEEGSESVHHNGDLQGPAGTRTGRGPDDICTANAHTDFVFGSPFFLKNENVSTPSLHCSQRTGEHSNHSRDAFGQHPDIV